ncbi:MAG TPA: hypothetical protein VEB65_13460, partial [Solirubrobacterales bacterium]|nr:hypothetical protein [Solirubrobacterales bacterium]
MKSLLRAAALAAVLATAVLAPSAPAAVRVEAPGKVAAPAAVRFAATASPGSRVTFLVDGRTVWHARAGAHGLRRHGALRLGIGRHALEVRGRRGSKVSVNRRVTRVVRPSSHPGPGSQPPAQGDSAGSGAGPAASGSSPNGSRQSQTGGKTGGTGTKPSGGGSVPGTTSPGATIPGTTTPGTTTPGTTESGGGGSTGGGEGTVMPPAEPTGAALFSSSRTTGFAANFSGPGAVTEVPDPLGSGQQVIKMTVS